MTISRNRMKSAPFLRLLILMWLAESLVLVSGCTPKFQSLHSINRERLQHLTDPLSALHYAPPALGVPASLPWGLFLGPLGGPVAWYDARSRGQAIMENTGLADPMESIKASFLTFLLQSHTAKAIDAHPDPLKPGLDSPSDLKKLSPWPLVLDFKTVDWGVGTSLGTDTYQVRYVGRVRLIDLSTDAILWQGVCDLSRDDSEHTLTFEELLDQEGARLKRAFYLLGQTCLHSLQEDFFRDPGNPQSIHRRGTPSTHSLLARVGVLSEVD